MITARHTLGHRIVRTLAAVLLLPLLIGAGYVYWYAVAGLEPGAPSYEVAPGTTLRGFAQKMHREGVLPDAHTLVLLAYLRGQQRQLKAGEYRFRRGISALEMLDQVIAGRVIEYPLTLVEGWSFKQMMEVVQAAPQLSHTLQGMSPAEIMSALGHPGVHPEGRFYPDTYFYARGMADTVILQRAYQKMERRLEQEWQSRDSTLPLASPYEALILASIVEKETGRAEERPLIAGVFINRLRKGMRLQTDPTVIYGLGERYDGNIRLKDLRAPTPYNTYALHGLPPTPIAMPSGAALHAALHPADTEAIYFVARGNGSHQFSATLSDHNAAVTRYQLGGQAPARPGGAPR